jgi:hypothetical protein
VSRFALLAACGLLLAAGGCGGGDDAPADQQGADLLVTVRPSGADGPTRRHHVVCERLGEGAPPCRTLSSARLRPVAPNVACTEIYGGPATARVRGTLAGKAVDARFDRTNGCEIARWERNRALLDG